MDCIETKASGEPCGKESRYGDFCGQHNQVINRIVERKMQELARADPLMSRVSDLQRELQKLQSEWRLKLDQKNALLRELEDARGEVDIVRMESLSQKCSIEAGKLALEDLDGFARAHAMSEIAKELRLQAWAERKRQGAERVRFRSTYGRDSDDTEIDFNDEDDD